MRRVVDFVGDPIPATPLAVLVSFYNGFARGFTRTQILKFSGDRLAPIAGVPPIIGLRRINCVLSTSGVGDAVAALAAGSQFPPLLLGWLIAALIAGHRIGDGRHHDRGRHSGADGRVDARSERRVDGAGDGAPGRSSSRT